jgi:hypothetical protein
MSKFKSNDKMTLDNNTTNATNAAFSKSVSCTCKVLTHILLVLHRCGLRTNKNKQMWEGQRFFEKFISKNVSWKFGEDFAEVGNLRYRDCQMTSYLNQSTISSMQSLLLAYNTVQYSTGVSFRLKRNLNRKQCKYMDFVFTWTSYFVSVLIVGVNAKKT